jgi:hypothetical protein
MAFVAMPIDSLQKRVADLRRAFAKGLGHKPSTLQAAAIQRSAMLVAQAERVLADPTASINDKVRIDGAARRALIDMQATLRPKLAASPISAFDKYIAERAG